MFSLIAIAAFALISGFSAAKSELKAIILLIFGTLTPIAIVYRFIESGILDGLLGIVVAFVCIIIGGQLAGKVN